MLYQGASGQNVSSYVSQTPKRQVVLWKSCPKMGPHLLKEALVHLSNAFLLTLTLQLTVETGALFNFIHFIEHLLCSLSTYCAQHIV